MGFCFSQIGRNIKLFPLEPFSLECQKCFIFLLASSEESGLQQRNDHIFPTKILQCTKIAQGSNRKWSWILDVNISFLLQVARPRFGPRLGVLLNSLRCGGKRACWRNRARSCSVEVWWVRKHGKLRTGGSAGIQSAVRSRSRYLQTHYKHAVGPKPPFKSNQTAPQSVTTRPEPPGFQTGAQVSMYSSSSSSSSDSLSRDDSWLDVS